MTVATHGLYRRMGIAAAIVAGGVLISRLLGLVRQIVFAWLLGAGATGDEYFVAFLIPDLLNYLLAGAYMAITLIPLLTRRFAAGDEADASPLLGGGSPTLDRDHIAGDRGDAIRRTAAAPGWNGFTDDQVAQAARLTRIVLPAQIFFVLGQLLTAWQFAREKFVIPTLGPIVYNLAIIAGGLIGGLGATTPRPTDLPGGALAGAVIGIFGLQVWGAWREGLRFPRRTHPPSSGGASVLRAGHPTHARTVARRVR